MKNPTFWIQTLASHDGRTSYAVTASVSLPPIYIIVDDNTKKPLEVWTSVWTHPEPIRVQEQDWHKCLNDEIVERLQINLGEDKL